MNQVSDYLKTVYLCISVIQEIRNLACIILNENTEHAAVTCKFRTGKNYEKRSKSKIIQAVLTEKSYQISKSNWFPDRVCIGGHKLLRSRCRIASLLSKYRTPFRYWRRALACCDYAQRCASRVLWRVALPRHRRNRSRWSEAIRGIRHKLREDACLSMRI